MSGNLEQRTRDFFNQSLSHLRKSLENDEITIAVEGADRKVRVLKADEFPQVGPRWRSIQAMEPGDLWNPVFIKTVQSLVVARTVSDPGSCIRIVRAEYFDPQKGFVPAFSRGEQRFTQKESDIAHYLGLMPNQRSKLKFLDSSNTLYITR